MSWALGAAIYVIIWWVVLFTILPLGVRTQEEAGAVTEGTPESAPARPQLGRKLAATTLVASIVFGGIYVLLVYKPIGLDDIPFPPPFERSATQDD